MRLFINHFIKDLVAIYTGDPNRLCTDEEKKEILKKPASSEHEIPDWITDDIDRKCFERVATYLDTLQPTALIDCVTVYTPSIDEIVGMISIDACDHSRFLANYFNGEYDGDISYFQYIATINHYMPGLQTEFILPTEYVSYNLRSVCYKLLSDAGIIDWKKWIIADETYLGLLDEDNWLADRDTMMEVVTTYYYRAHHQIYVRDNDLTNTYSAIVTRRKNVKTQALTDMRIGLFEGNEDLVGAAFVSYCYPEWTKLKGYSSSILSLARETVGYLFTPEQEALLSQAREDGVDIKLVYTPAYNVDQMRVLLSAIESGLNIKIFAKPEYPSSLMLKIKSAMIRGLDLSIYLNNIQKWILYENDPANDEQLAELVPEHICEQYELSDVVQRANYLRKFFM